MLLNSSLTTLPYQAAAHSKLGWQEFTLKAIQTLAMTQPLVLLAWGNQAKDIADQVTGNVRVIESAHPSPLSASRGFFGSKPFSRANQALIELGLEPIDWSL
jgi:uracil-DNA glycosylase